MIKLQGECASCEAVGAWNAQVLRCKETTVQIHKGGGQGARERSLSQRRCFFGHGCHLKCVATAATCAATRASCLKSSLSNKLMPRDMSVDHWSFEYGPHDRASALYHSTEFAGKGICTGCVSVASENSTLRRSKSTNASSAQRRPRGLHSW